MIRQMSRIGAVLAFVCLPQMSLASVIFSSSGNDLLVDINVPIAFTANADFVSSPYQILAIVFEDVYSTPVAATVQASPSVVTSTMTLDGDTSVAYASWGHTSGIAGEIDSTDFFGGYTFGVIPVVDHGDSVTVSAGIVTVSDFFLNPNAQLPDVAPTSARLIDPFGNSLSAPVALSSSSIPEPSSLALFATGCAGLLYRRRRRLSA